MTATEASALAPRDLDAGAAALLALVRRRGPLTRAQMTAETGWARVTVTTRLEQLLSVGFLIGDQSVNGARGRPATRYRIDPTRAALLVADIGALGMRLARVDLDGGVEATIDRRIEIGEGPDRVLEVARACLGSLAISARERPVWGVAMSLPGPVEFDTGRVVSPPIMTGWDGFPVRDTVTGWFNCPVLVDNDVNAMAVGEQSATSPAASDLLVVKVGTGVGSGIISGGRVLRGVSGAAGDIGHTWADTGPLHGDPPECRCGKHGCVEAYVGGWAIARDLGAELGRPVDVDTVVDLLDAGEQITVRLVREAGRILGASLATAVSLLNPMAVVLGGQVAAAAGEHLLSGLRERIYARSLPLATRGLDIRTSTLGRDAGVHGLAKDITDVVLAGTRPVRHERQW